MNWKFRGVTEDKKWVVGSLVRLDYHNSVDYVESTQIVLENGHSFEVLPETVGAFTGLLDKHGKEIFEGDICVYLGRSMSDMEIAFENGCFVGKGPFNTNLLIKYLNAEDFESIEVTGNIHEGDR